MLKSTGSLQSTHQIGDSPAAKICYHNLHGLQRGYEIILEKLKIKSKLHLKRKCCISVSMSTQEVFALEQPHICQEFWSTGKVPLRCCRVPLVRQLRIHLLMDLHERTCDICTVTPWDCSSNFGETGSYISSVPAQEYTVVGEHSKLSEVFLQMTFKNAFGAGERRQNGFF